MKAIIRKPESKYPKTNKQPLCHGSFVYECEKCGTRFSVFLEKGVEGKNKIMPCPFVIGCRHSDCNGLARHTEWQSDKTDMPLFPLPAGKLFFRLNKKEGCGVATLYEGGKQ